MKRWLSVMGLPPLLVLLSGIAPGQARKQEPQKQSAQKPAAEPVTPAARAFHDTRYGVRFQVPAAWNFTQKDGELSTFQLDARSAGKGAQLRAVAAIAFNPYPLTTFTGALFYFSVRPKTSAAQCAAEAGVVRRGASSETKLGGVSFLHGHDESGKMCVEARDDVYTTTRNGACYRFDLAMNTFCSDTSASRDMSPSEVENIRKRMESILLSVTFDKP